MNAKTMVRFALRGAVCLGLLGPSGTWAQAPSQGAWVARVVQPQGPQESHPKKLRAEMAITQELGGEGGASPLYFGAEYNNGLYQERTKVIFRVEVYRGSELLWSAKRKKKVDANGKHIHVFCDAYDGGLVPGDRVVFTYKFKKKPRPGEVGSIALLGEVGPTVMWDTFRDGWWFYDEFDCSG